MFNEKILFGFLNLGDDMLFPEYNNYEDVFISKDFSHTLAQDSFIVAAPAYDTEKTGSVLSLKVNGTQIIPRTANTIPFISLFVSKGSVISAASSFRITLRIFPLTRKGGGN